MPSEFKNILQHSNVHFVQSDSLEPTTFDPICVRILMSVLSFVQFVAKLSLGNMIENVMKDCILEKRSLFARAS